MKSECKIFGHELNEKFHFLSSVRDDEFELERRVLVVVVCFTLIFVSGSGGAALVKRNEFNFVDIKQTSGKANSTLSLASTGKGGRRKRMRTYEMKQQSSVSG